MYLAGIFTCSYVCCRDVLMDPVPYIGHWHYYESLYPAQNGKTGIGGAPIQKDFVNPPVTVHVTTGNGGPPGKDTFTEGKYASVKDVRLIFHFDRNYRL